MSKIRIIPEILPAWDEDIGTSDYNGIQVVKDINIKDGFKVYIHNIPDDGHCVRIGIFTYVHQLRNLAKAIGVNYPIKSAVDNKKEKDTQSDKELSYYWDEFGNKKYFK